MIYKIKKTDFIGFLNELSKKSLCFVPYEQNQNFFLDLFDFNKADAIVLNQVRQSQPIKSFLLHPRKELTQSQNSQGNIVVFGIKACDVASIYIQDFVFLQGDVKDPFYLKNREDIILISSDCGPVRETCFCTAMDGKPYPEKGFDAHLSFAGEDYLMETGSSKGQAFLTEYASFFTQASDREIDERNKWRAKTVNEVESFVKARGTPQGSELGGKVRQNYDSQLWKDFYSTCVECGACNLACATCHCFLIFDKSYENRPKRFMEWDACLYRRFARVAGGANPRKHLWERLRNRFEKKFDYFPKVMGANACTGCGRCIEACPGDIDIREVLKGLVHGKWNNPPND